MDTALVISSTSVQPGAWSRWGGRALSGLSAAFLAFDGAMKVVHPAFVREASTRIGFPDAAVPVLGIVLLASVALYLLPRWAPLGAALLTGYLGGAVAIHVRASDPLFSHVLFPVYFGVMIWGGLFLRDARVRGLLGPVR